MFNNLKDEYIMSDDSKKPDTTPTDETLSGKVTFNTQADFDAVIQNRLAKEKAKYSDYDETKEQLATLKAKQDERDKAEMSELEKANAERDEIKLQNEELTSQNTKYKEQQEARDIAEQEKIEKASADLTDPQKVIVNNLPLYNRMDAITEFTNNAPGGMSGGGKNSKGTVMTAKEIMNLPADQQMAEYAKIRGLKQ